ncbi:DNA-3-methyladenine glycosylase I [Catenibacterium sp. GCM10023432]|uniref:DNA-3-methyladenine glycosylase I n=1 Tax=Catenibacterium sp. GCM10023432 TaxID=3252638 RepID=UPI003611497E
MRCSWAKSKEAIKYHDNRWCKETHDEKMLFKMLVLEGMQAGLSWDTILKKEEAYNQAFDDFDYHKIASYSKEKIESLYEAEGIIHNHLKINSIIINAQIVDKLDENINWAIPNWYFHFLFA